MLVWTLCSFSPEPPPLPPQYTSSSPDAVRMVVKTLCINPSTVNLAGEYWSTTGIQHVSIHDAAILE